MTSSHPGVGMTSQRTRLRMVERLRDQGIRDEAVLSALAEIPRHIFVDEALAHRAYEDIALPIGFGQTISQPWIVARMLELVRGGEPLGRVLEIGTGCGYQAAVLARLAREVYSVERLSSLLMKARVRLRELRINNVRVKHADGQFGLKEAGPFDGIVMLCRCGERAGGADRTAGHGGPPGASAWRPRATSYAGGAHRARRVANRARRRALRAPASGRLGVTVMRRAGVALGSLLTALIAASCSSTTAPVVDRPVWDTPAAPLRRAPAGSRCAAVRSQPSRRP